MDSNNKTELIDKYNVAGPRYTSYPTVPHWKEQNMDPDWWSSSVLKSFTESNEKEGISLYIHLPFCESLCTFCACHKRITKRHSVEAPYIKTVLKEWALYLRLFNSRPLIKELHLGGGTPTFFSPENLKLLINGILEDSDLDKDYEFSFEGHPNNTTKEHLEVLYDLGFSRVSYGVQDYDERVQFAINRIQPFANVKRVTDQAKALGYESISHDLVFGLPHQTMEAIEETISKTSELKPDRISFYSYAHVPWIKNLGQRGFKEDDLPGPELKREMYSYGKQILQENGYYEIGMDHFALSSDSMFHASQNKSLHRNFMGYTPSKTSLMIGLGMSSISDSWYGFAQNIKSLKDYSQCVEQGQFPVFRGHRLTDKDLIVRQHILNIMCHFETSWLDTNMRFPELEDVMLRLTEMERDGLILIDNHGLKVLDHAKAYVRNACMAFDLHLNSTQHEKRIFSMTI